MGGPQTPGVLVFKKTIVDRCMSSSPGGGSIFYVGRAGHVYLKGAEEREEAGTPSIVGAVRVACLMTVPHPTASCLILSHSTASYRIPLHTVSSLWVLRDPASGPGADALYLSSSCPVWVLLA